MWRMKKASLKRKYFQSLSRLENLQVLNGLLAVLVYMVVILLFFSSCCLLPDGLEHFGKAVLAASLLSTGLDLQNTV